MRLDTLVAAIVSAIPSSDATLVAVEGPSFGSTGGAQHERGGLWWLVRHTLRAEGLDVVVVPPTVVRSTPRESATLRKAACSPP